MKQNSTQAKKISAVRQNLSKLAFYSIAMFCMLGVHSRGNAQCAITSQPTNNCASFGMWISAFTLNNIATTGSNSCSPNGYASFTSPVWNLTTGQTYTFSATTVQPYAVGFSIWIDLDNDGQYSSSEMVWGSSSTGFSFTGSFTIPSTLAPATNVAMRIRSAYSYNMSGGDACTSNVGSYGETEDYKVNIIGVPCTGQPTAGTVTVANSTFNCAGVPQLSVTGSTVGLNLQYQWQTRPVGGTTWTNSGTVQTTPQHTAASISTSTQYRVWIKCTNSNLTDTSAPKTVTVNVTSITPSTTTSLCTPPGSQVLTISTPVLPDTMFKQNFEGSTSNMTVTSNVNNSNSTGWSFVTGPYVNSNLSGQTYNSGSKFAFVGLYSSTGTFESAMALPALNTTGYSALTLYFRHTHYNNSQSGFEDRVQVSTNGGTTWTTLNTYNGQIGSQQSFTSTSINLNAYINMPSVLIRYYSLPGTLGSYWYTNWGVDDIAVVGTAATPQYSWTASPSAGAGLPTGAGTADTANRSITVNPTATGTITYTGTITGAVAGCATTKQAVLVVNPKPVASLTANNTEICNGSPVVLSMVFSGGAPPYNLTYTDGVTTTSTTNSTATMNVTLTPNTNRVYRILSLYNATCTAGQAQIPDSAVLTVFPRPTAAMNSQSYNVCDGTTAFLPVTLTGTPPFTITYSNGSTNTTLNNIMTNNYQMPVPTVIGTTTYTITGLTDMYCSAIAADITGNNVVNGYVRPTAQLTGNPSICNGSFGYLQVAFTGAPPYSFTYGDGGNFTYSVSNVNTNSYTLQVTPSSSVTYMLTAVNDQNCASISQDMTGASNVTVKSRPTGVMTGSPQTVCFGSPASLTVNFTGTPPFSMLYSNGQGSTLISPINTNSYTFNANPQASGNYVISALNDASCVALSSDLTGSTAVTVRKPEAVISGSQVSCSGGSTNINVDFTGAGATAPYTFTYTDGNQTNTLTTTSDPYTFSVNTTGSTTYTLTSFNDANCIGSVSGSAVIIANPTGGWNGMTSSDWQNAANWCGGVPTPVTDVTIPSVAPNMPILSNGNGFSRNLTVDVGASMSITNGANFFLHGDLTNNGSLQWQTGNVAMNGSTPQTVAGFTSQNLLINNMSGVTPIQDISVNGVLFLDGNIYLNNTDLIMKPGSSLAGEEEFQFVHTMGTGTMKRNVSVNDVVFPVGRSSYNPVTLRNLGVQDVFSVRVTDEVYADGTGGTSTATVQFPVVNRTWMIGEAVTGGSIVTITPTWYNHPGEEINFFDRGHSFLRHWDGTSWAYVDSINALPCTGYNTFGPYSISESGHSQFSPFTVGGWNLWPLAIELLDFTATLQNNENALLNWNISQSSDAMKFEVERSEDGKVFNKVTEVAAVDKKTAYTTTDRGLSEGRHYYRLLVTDNAGKSAYSNVATVITKGMGVEVISLSPNPVTGIGVIAISSDDAAEAEVRILDAVGREMYKGKHALGAGLSNISLDLNSLAQGNYTLHVMTSNGKSTPVKFTKL